MVEEGMYSALCAQMNSALDVRDLIDYVGWHPDKLLRSGDVYIAFCPIHEDTVFRTLVLNPRNNTYHCKHVNCPGNRPSDFLDLLVKVRDKPLSVIVAELIEHFGASHFRLTPRQEQLAREFRGVNVEPPER